MMKRQNGYSLIRFFLIVFYFSSFMNNFLSEKEKICNKYFISQRNYFIMNKKYLLFQILRLNGQSTNGIDQS